MGKLTKIANVLFFCMPTQNVNLTPALDLFVKEQVQSGYYNNASEVHRAALASMARDEEERQLRLQVLRDAVQVGVDDIENGRYQTVSSAEEHSEFFDHLRNRVLSGSRKD